MIQVLAVYAFGCAVAFGIYFFPPTAHGQARQVEVFAQFVGRRVRMVCLILVACLAWPVIAVLALLDTARNAEWFE